MSSNFCSSYLIVVQCSISKRRLYYIHFRSFQDNYTIISALLSVSVSRVITNVKISINFSWGMFQEIKQTRAQHDNTFGKSSITEPHKKKKKNPSRNSSRLPSTASYIRPQISYIESDVLNASFRENFVIPFSRRISTSTLIYIPHIYPFSGPSLPSPSVYKSNQRVEVYLYIYIYILSYIYINGYLSVCLLYTQKLLIRLR